MKIDGVFSGGGVKAFAFLGACEVLEDKGIVIERVAGTSAGAVIASFISAGYTTNEIFQLMEDINIEGLLDRPLLGRIPLFKWISFYYHKGIYKGDKFENWIYDILAKKGIYTFADIKPGYLKIIVSDITLGKLVVIPDDLERLYGIQPNQFSVAKAVRMSAGFPYYFIPQKLKNNLNGISYLVDGGLLSNFPLWLFDQHERNKRPVLGFSLSDSVACHTNYPIHNIFNMLQALFTTMQRAHDARYIVKTKARNIIFIPVKEIDTMAVNITDKEKAHLVSLGKQQTTAYFKKTSIK